MDRQQSLFDNNRDHRAFWLSKVRCEILKCYAAAEEFYLQSFPRPEVQLNLRGRSAGVAELQNNRLRFNPVLLKENQQEFLEQVVPHEVAHLLAWHLHGRSIRPHGREWQQIMRQVFAVKPSTTHAFDVSRSARQGYIYQCGCANKQHALTVRRHNKIQRGQKYACQHCGSILSFLFEDESVTKT